MEACIGETIAAVEARSALARVEDEAVRGVLMQIADDEARHAELGFRFVKWMLDTQPRDVSRLLVQEMESLLAAELAAECGDNATSPVSQELVAHGMLDAAARSQARRAALNELCIPCVEALRLSAPRPSAPAECAQSLARSARASGGASPG